MKRREFLFATTITAGTLFAPAILSAQASSGTPVVDGKRVRRRLSTLADNDPFFEAYRRAVELMHQQPDSSPLSWIAQARTHGDFCEHGNPEFFPWHRPYLVMFERICGSLIGDPNFALPYWDWGDNRVRLPAPFFGGSLDATSWNDDGNYMGQNWGLISTTPYRHGRPDYGAGDDPRFAGPFSAASLRAMENARDFQLLSDLTENPHGLVHVFTGGHPNFGLGTGIGHLSSGLSPLDPCFWLHHANVDRIWAQSTIPIADQINAMPDPDKAYANIFYDENSSPITPVVRDLFELEDQDYIYDFMIPELLSVEQLAIEEQIAAAQSQLLALADRKNFNQFDFRNPTTVFAEAAVDDNVSVGAIRRIDVQSEGVTDVITSQTLVPRALSINKEAYAVESGRVYVRFRDVAPLPASDGSSIRVFVDCPYLSDATPTTDPHFAGMLSFFGCNPEVCGTRSFSVDITDPLKYLLGSGALTPNNVQLQLLSIGGSGELTGKPVTKVGSVELIAA